MNPEIKLSPEVIEHLKDLEATIKQWLAAHQEIPSDDILAKEFTEQKEKYLDLLKDVTSTLSTASAKATTSVPPDSISQFYEMAVELGIQMGTAATVTIATNYQNALDRFFNAYELGDENLQAEWLEAKKELEESDLVLKAKVSRAQQVSNNNRTNIPPGGYFRFVEGQKGNDTYYRLDWLSRMTDINGEAYHRDNNPDNHEYTAGTDRYLIEVYQANIDDAGIVTFARNGSANSLNKKGLELFNMLSSPYLTLEETGNKSFPALKYNETSKNTIQSRWSISLWDSNSTATAAVAEVIELPDWNDYGFRALYNKFKTKCDGASLSKDESIKLKKRMTKAVAQQKKLYQTLNIIRKELAAREDGKLVQQKEEIIALLKIWNKRIKTYEPSIAALNCTTLIVPPPVVVPPVIAAVVPPPVVPAAVVPPVVPVPTPPVPDTNVPALINISTNLWTAAITNRTQAVADLEAAGILDWLRTHPTAVIQITATFDHGNNAGYLSNPGATMSSMYSPAARTANNIPNNIRTPRDQLSVKAQNIANLISSQAGIANNQVTPNTTPGDTGTHMGNGAPFGRRVIITWINDGK